MDLNHITTTLVDYFKEIESEIPGQSNLTV